MDTDKETKRVLLAPPPSSKSAGDSPTDGMQVVSLDTKPIQQQPEYTVQTNYPTQVYYQAQPGYPQQNGYPYPQQNGYPSLSSSHQQAPGQHSVFVAGIPQVQQMPTVPPPSYMIVSWLACLFCCWPIGIGAIIASSQVNEAIKNNDMQKAMKSSSLAKNLSISAIVCGSFALAAVVILYMTNMTRTSRY